MGLLKLLFGPGFEPQELDHPVLGKLVSDRCGNWNGKKNIEFLERELDLTIKTQEILENHVTFVTDIEARFPQIYASLKQGMFRDLDDFADGTTMEQLFDSLVFDYINIYAPKDRRWELSATTELDDHIFNVQMEGFSFLGFSMDG